MQFRSTRPLPNTTAIAADWYRRPNVTGFSLLTSLFAHILIILGIGFMALSSTPAHIQPIVLDFTLVDTADTPPEHTNVLAQHNQRGGRDASPTARTAPFQLSLQRPSLDVQRYQRGFLPNSSRRQREVVMVNATPITPTNMQATLGQDPAAGNTAAPRRETQTPNIPLVAEVGRLQDRSQELAGHTFISANTRESIYAAYMATWRDRVQRIGNLNYPSVVRQQRLIGSVVLEVVVGRSGNLLDIHIVKSSGRKTLDDTAIQLARLASPFAPLPAAIRRKTSALHITRTWRFTNNAELFGAPQIRIN
ncbi:MAG: energy transducer TonB [Arenicellales bacterium]|nr:energy transducer TonB [Arenicellales bacterium]